ncbi:MAG TPA: hypothetical protein H9790_04130 [Candidatus Agathobaculum intestinipullorum]|nr:hypothetical protein [Candidatus Agathobaculum intestinipullorum]
MLDELGARLFVAVLLHTPQQFGLLVRGKRLGERAIRPLHAQHQKKTRAAKRQQGRQQHKNAPHFCIGYRYPMRGGGCPMPLEKRGCILPPYPV